jgi:ParB-like nuclease domain
MTPTRPELIRLDSIPDDHATQARDATDSGIVEEYSAAMKDGATFPPVVLFRDQDGTLRIGDGFHRVAAARLAGLDSIEADVRDGSARAALDCSIQANARHGLRFNNRDKRRAVGLLLDDAEWSTLSDREIGRRCGVSQPFVGKLRAERRDNGYHPADALTPDEQARLIENETVIRAGLDNARAALGAFLSAKARLGKEQYTAWLDHEFPGRWLDMLDDLAMLLSAEADHKRLLDAYPAPIVGDLPMGSLDAACAYSATGRRETFAKVFPSTTPGYWFASVFRMGDDEREVIGWKRPMREDALPIALHGAGFVSDGTPWTSEPAEPVASNPDFEPSATANN